MLRRIKKIEKIQFILDDEDVIKMDVPLMIRLLEYAKETSTTDVDLHEIAERLVENSKDNKVLDMEYYFKIIDKPEEPEESSVLTEESMKFRMDSRTLWSRFGWSPLNYSIALNNNLEGLTETENRIYKHAARLGDFVVPYYGADVGKTLGDALSDFGRIGVNVMQDLKNGKPLDGTKERWDQSVENIATFLSTINPTYWPKEPVKSYFDTLVNFWIDSIRDRENKDFISAGVAVDGIEKLVTLGSGDSTSLADVFSAGIIAQFPEKFTD